MGALRSRRLEALFGVETLDELTAERVGALVDTGAQEAFDLEFKRPLYGSSDGDKRDLAGDVSAMANTAGGVIVLGIDEDEDARASSAPGVHASDAEVGRIRQIIAALVSPLPTFDVLLVRDKPGEETDEDQEGQFLGFVVIAVPRSPRFPHAVLVNQTSLRYPTRNGTTIRYLSEPEVAAAYASRIASASAQEDRIEAVSDEAIMRLDHVEYAWLLVTLVPDLSGDMTISAASFKAFQAQILTTQTAIINIGRSFQRARVGVRRFLADGTIDNGPLARWVSLEAHSDGCGAYGFHLYDMLERSGPTAETTGRPKRQMIDDEIVAVAILSGLIHLGEHARDRGGSGGDALVRAYLVTATSAEATEIGHTRHGPRDSRSSATVADPTVAAETVAALDDLATPCPATVAVAAALLDQLGQPFGIPEMGQLTRDGEVRRRYWSHGLRPAIERWAAEHEISVSDAALER